MPNFDNEEFKKMVSEQAEESGFFGYFFNKTEVSFFNTPNPFVPVGQEVKVDKQEL